MRVLPMGVAAVIVEEPPVSPAAWALGLRALGHAGVIDVVPAASTVLVSCTDADALDAVVRRFGEVEPVAVAGHGGHVTIDVAYEGDDLDEVAASAQLSVDEVIAAHTAAEYRVAFCGFAPGFGYLTGLPAVLHLPRRATPRTRVPAGAVAIAAEYAAVYPRPSPGGWHLIGYTDHVLFDVDRDPPAVLRPGTVVRFRRAT
jgi:KipI family sensor histidine kinase inhibitor